ncbi:Uncharacterised protein [Mycobacteroides abscessus subsp. abscessus]|nr:Uncharacterised protein [Mycobacteroides abscessus subsp. abscessus]
MSTRDSVRATPYSSLLGSETTAARTPALRSWSTMLAAAAVDLASPLIAPTRTARSRPSFEKPATPSGTGDIVDAGSGGVEEDGAPDEGEAELVAGALEGADEPADDVDVGVAAPRRYPAEASNSSICSAPGR